jgi:hypothetical protein
MVETAYDKYFVPIPAGRGGFFPVLVANGGRDFEGAEFSIRMHYIAGPGILIKEPHSHNFDQFYCFIGADLANPQEFKAEVEFSLGAEGNVRLITSPTTVHVPKDMIHGPMNFKKIDRPIIFVDCLLSAQYSIK